MNLLKKKSFRLGDEEKYCSITFDDGIIDHYENALPELLRRGIKACFFPISCTFDGVVPLTHKVHIILAKLSIEVLVLDLENHLLFVIEHAGSQPQGKSTGTLAPDVDDVAGQDFHMKPRLCLEHWVFVCSLWCLTGRKCFY